MIERRLALFGVVTACAVLVSCGWPRFGENDGPGAAAVVAAEAPAAPADADGASAPAAPAAKPDPAAMRQYIRSTPRQPSEPIIIGQVWVGRDHSATYDVEDTGSDLEDGRMTLRGDSQGAWSYARLGQRVEKLQLGEDGSLLLSELDNIEKDAIIRFNPPVVVVPAKLEPGKPVTTTAKMTVLERGEPSKVKSSGKTKLTVVYDATQTLTTPAGKYDCHRIRLDWDAEFGFGSTHSAITCYYSPEVGLVAEDYQSRTNVLLFEKERQITAVLSEPPRVAATGQ